jgi:hypothetical protein
VIAIFSRGYWPLHEKKRLFLLLKQYYASFNSLYERVHPLKSTKKITEPDTQLEQIDKIIEILEPLHEILIIPPPTQTHVVPRTTENTEETLPLYTPGAIEGEQVLEISPPKYSEK